MAKDKDYPPKDRLLPQYAHLKGMAECMPVIRKLLGMPEYGELPNTPIGRALQKLANGNRKDVVR